MTFAACWNLFYTRRLRAEMIRLLAEVKNAPYAMAIIPLLFETNMLNEMIHRILVVDCEKETQITRASRRPGAEFG